MEGRVWMQVQKQSRSNLCSRGMRVHNMHFQPIPRRVKCNAIIICLCLEFVVKLKDMYVA